MGSTYLLLKNVMNNRKINEFFFLTGLGLDQYRRYDPKVNFISYKYMI